MTDQQLTIFAVLSELNKKNYFLFEQLSEAEQRGFQPLVLMRWMLASGVDPVKLQSVNHRFFSLSKQAQFMALATAGDKRTKRWKWTKNTSSSPDEVLNAIMYVYDTDKKTAEQSVLIFSKSEIDAIVEEYRDHAKATSKEKKSRR